MAETEAEVGAEACSRFLDFVIACQRDSLQTVQPIAIALAIIFAIAFALGPWPLALGPWPLALVPLCP